MKVTEIDKPIQAPVRVYLDVESFVMPSLVNPKILFTPQWVNQVINKLSFDFEFYGLQHRKTYNLLKSEVNFDFVQEVVEMPREHWGTFLREQGTVIFYYGRPSHVEILSSIPETHRFPFTSNLEVIKNIVVEHVNVASFVNVVAPGKRGKDNRVIKFNKDMF